jgi:formate dehydrogenase iron-sulfur subunit
MSSEGKTLVDKQSLLTSLLQEQQELTAVEEFSQKHENKELPVQKKYYESLIPLSQPKAGQQYAFKVNLDACTGCKACVTACHNLNGLDEDETWRGVGLLRGGNREEANQQHVTSACHHCLDPACASGCPVNAYDKDEVTGIVKHLDDQCIGCQYCILKCPYEVPKYNKRLGIVRKCDMCTHRLEVGEAPACVQSCPTSAISIQIVDKDRILEDSQDSVVVPGAPSSEFTQPTTIYESSKPLQKNMLGSDYYSLHPQHSHPPLVGMLVLTQLSVGAFCVDILTNHLQKSPLISEMQPFHSIIALCLGLLALGVSVLHLGRPQYAFRALLGLKTSWLSREILAFNLFAGFASTYAVLFWVSQIEAYTGLVLPAFLKEVQFREIIGIGVALSGLLGIICSVMIYDDCKKELWRGSITGLKFFGTALTLGLATIMVSSLAGVYFLKPENGHLISTVYTSKLSLLMIFAFTAKLLWEASIFRHLKDQTYSMFKRSALVMVNHLPIATKLRYACGLLGGVVLPILIYVISVEVPPSENHLYLMFNLSIASFILALFGEFCERFLFFAAVVSKKMPGGV